MLKNHSKGACKEEEVRVTVESHTGKELTCGVPHWIQREKIKHLGPSHK